MPKAKISYGRWHYRKDGEEIVVDSFGRPSGTNSPILKSLSAIPPDGIESRFNQVHKFLISAGWVDEALSTPSNGAELWWSQAMGTIWSARLCEIESESKLQEAERVAKSAEDAEDAHWASNQLQDASCAKQQAQIEYRIGLILIAMAAEAHVNFVGMNQVDPKEWPSVDRMGLIGKWLKVCKTVNKTSGLNWDTEPIRTLRRLVDWRNDIVHTKPSWFGTNFSSRPPIHFETSTPQDVSYPDCVDFVKALIEAMSQLHGQIGDKPPSWVRYHAQSITGEKCDWLWDDDIYE